VLKEFCMNRRKALATTWAGGVAAWAGTAAQAQAQATLVAGEVVKVDRAAGRVTLKHGEIKSLDMPPMTLAWRVAQLRWLEDLAVGDRVRFAPARIDGQYTITTLIKAPQ
jgi:Cu/Ag efflux protein CusF